MQKKQIQINTYHQTALTIMVSIILAFLNFSISAREPDDDSDNKIRTVVIDPGHGGKDPGALGKYSYEKDVVLAIGLKLGAYIEKYMPDVKVIYTRKTDIFPELYRRAEIANEADADLFISIHANGSPSTKAKGSETFVLGLHRSEESFEVAKRENSVILLEEDYDTRYENFDPNSPESYIIFSLMQNIYDLQSIGFAGNVQDQFRDRVHRIDRGVKRLGLLVLAQISMPGVLVETGFITNPAEEDFLNSKEGQEYLASAIYRAFKDYKNEIEAKSSPSNNLPAGNFEVETVPVDKKEQVKTSSQNEDTVRTETSKRDKDLMQDSLSGKNGNTSQLPTQEDTLKTNNVDIYFKVQIHSSPHAIPLSASPFQEYSDIEEFQIENIYKYAVGYKRNYVDIIEYSKWVKNRNPDAFIIAVQNGKIITIQSALKQLELNYN